VVHLPGKFIVNTAWLALTVMAHDLSRAVGQLAGPELEKSTAATLRHKVFTMPGRSSTPDAGDNHTYPRPGPGPTRSCKP
jgi:hypothetical protein